MITSRPLSTIPKTSLFTTKTRRSMFAASARAPPKSRKQPSPLAVLVRDAVAELAVLVAVGLTHVGEVVDVPGGDLREVERVLARVEAESDDDVVLAQASPNFHRALVPAEADVAESVFVRRV